MLDEINSLHSRVEWEVINTERNWTSEQQMFHMKLSAVNQATQEGVTYNTHRRCEITNGYQSGQRRNETMGSKEVGLWVGKKCFKKVFGGFWKEATVVFISLGYV